jgi:hypothetical protein
MTDPALAVRLAFAKTAEGRAKAAKLIKEREPSVGLGSVECTHCRERFINKHPADHPDECCDCFDLHCGKPLGLINARRTEQGLAKIPRRRKR